MRGGISAVSAQWRGGQKVSRSHVATSHGACVMVDNNLKHRAQQQRFLLYVRNALQSVSRIQTQQNRNLSSNKLWEHSRFTKNDSNCHQVFSFYFIHPHMPLKRGNWGPGCVQFSYLTQTAVHKPSFKTIFLANWSCVLIQACLFWATTGCWIMSKTICTFIYLYPSAKNFQEYTSEVVYWWTLNCLCLECTSRSCIHSTLSWLVHIHLWTQARLKLNCIWHLKWVGLRWIWLQPWISFDLWSPFNMPKIQKPLEKCEVVEHDDCSDLAGSWHTPAGSSTCSFLSLSLSHTHIPHANNTAASAESSSFCSTYKETEKKPTHDSALAIKKMRGLCD